MIMRLFDASMSVTDAGGLGSKGLASDTNG